MGDGGAGCFLALLLSSLRVATGIVFLLVLFPAGCSERVGDGYPEELKPFLWIGGGIVALWLIVEYYWYKNYR